MHAGFLFFSLLTKKPRGQLLSFPLVELSFSVKCSSNKLAPRFARRRGCCALPLATPQRSAQSPIRSRQQAYRV